MKLSVLMAVTQDVEFLPVVLEHLYDRAHQVVLVDGPYRWMLEYYAGLPFDLGAPISDVKFRGKPLTEWPKIEIRHAIWKGELEKRKSGYERCTGDLVMVVDSDEIVTIDEEALARFVDSETSVAQSTYRSFVRSDISCDWRISSADEARSGAPVRYRRLFKRANVNAENHLAYLSMVHLGPVIPDPGGAIYEHPVANVRHLAALRTGHSNFVKYLYYYALYHLRTSTANLMLRAGRWSTYGEPAALMEPGELRRLCMRCSPHSIRCPDDRYLMRTEPIPASLKDVLADDSAAHREFALGAAGGEPLVSTLPAYFYVPCEYRESGCVLRLELDNTAALIVHDRAFYLESDNSGDGIRRYDEAVRDGRAEIVIPPCGDHRAEMFERILCLVATATEGRLARIEHVEYGRI